MWGAKYSYQNAFDAGLAALNRTPEPKQPLGKKRRAWFNLGRYTALLANMAATGAPQQTFNQAMGGYRAILLDAGIAPNLIDQVNALIQSLQNQPLPAQQQTLSQIFQILRAQAIAQYQASRWPPGAFWAFVVAILAAVAAWLAVSWKDIF
jgi:hypothetical protein